MPFVNGQWTDKGDFDFAGRFQEGYDTRMKRGATEDARDAYEAGDADRAAQLIMPYDPQAASGYRDEGTRAYQRRYADAYGSGDFERAQTEARTRGDLTGLEAARTGQNNSRFRGQVAEANKYRADLRRIHALADPKAKNAAYDQFLARAAEETKASGQDPRFLSQIKETFPEWNEQAFTALDTMLLQAARAYATDDPESYVQNWVKEQELALTQRKAERDDQRLEFEGRRVTAAEATAQAALARAENGGNAAEDKKTQRDFTNAGQLRDDYRNEPLVKGYQEIKSVFDRSMAYVNRIGAGRGAPVGDIGLVFALAKINDPTSVVREQEFAQIAQSGGLGAQIKNLYSQASGRGFDPATRRQLLTEIRSSYEAYSRNYNSKRAEYAELARRYGIAPGDVVLGWQDAPAEAPTNTPPSDPALTPTQRGTGPTRSFQTMPPANRLAGKTITDSSTGKRYRSDGRQWVEVQ